GLSRVYPPEHAELARRISSSGGCTLSEFPLEAEPLAAHFPRRNRVLSGLAWGVVVVEGALKSGSLITARLAAAQGREVFAVPGPAGSPQSQAPHLLLSEGAAVARSMADVWAGLPPGCRPEASLIERAARDPRAAALQEGLAEEHRKIIQLLTPDPL